MTELFTHEEEEVLNQIPNNFPLQFEEDEEEEEEDQKETEEARAEEVIDFRSKHYFRRIVVWDGIIKGKFTTFECCLAGSQVWIPRDFKIFQRNLLSKFESLSSISFESNSHLTRIESEAFSSSSLQSILIPRNVEIAESKCLLS
jgi:hypothetical protein